MKWVSEPRRQTSVWEFVYITNISLCECSQLATWLQEFKVHKHTNTISLSHTHHKHTLSPTHTHETKRWRDISYHITISRTLGVVWILLRNILFGWTSVTWHGALWTSSTWNGKLSLPQALESCDSKYYKRYKIVQNKEKVMYNEGALRETPVVQNQN